MAHKTHTLTTELHGRMIVRDGGRTRDHGLSLQIDILEST